MTLDELLNRNKHAEDCQCDACENNRYWEFRRKEGTLVPVDDISNYEPRDDAMLELSHWDK